MTDVFDLGLVLLKLDDLGFFVFEELKWFNEGLQGFARISNGFTKIYEDLQKFTIVGNLFLFNYFDFHGNIIL